MLFECWCKAPLGTPISFTHCQAKTKVALGNAKYQNKSDLHKYKRISRQNKSCLENAKRWVFTNWSDIKQNKSVLQTNIALNRRRPNKTIVCFFWPTLPIEAYFVKHPEEHIQKPELARLQSGYRLVPLILCFKTCLWNNCVKVLILTPLLNYCVVHYYSMSKSLICETAGDWD